MPSAEAAGASLAGAGGPSLLDVDIGGTFTDAFVVLGGRQATGKSPTIHADLSDGMIEAIGQAARRLGCEPADAFAAADAVKYSTTVGTNALIERTDPKVGLITTAGHYGEFPVPVQEIDDREYPTEPATDTGTWHR